MRHPAHGRAYDPWLPESSPHTCGRGRPGEQRTARAVTYPRGHPFAFTDAECDSILEAIKALPATDGCSIGGHGTIRRYVIEDGAQPWLAERLVQLFTEANAYWWRFELHAFGVNVLVYEPGAAYPWHTDTAPGMTGNKLSLSAPLVPPADYTGGRLEAQFGGHRQSFPRLRGGVTIFPGWTPHQVTEVDTGERAALVAWATGPPFV